MTGVKKNDDRKGVFNFLFLGTTELEYQEHLILNIHQNSTFVTNFTEAKKQLKNSYDAFIVNERHLLEPEVLTFFKHRLHRSFLILLSDKFSTKHNFVDCYLNLDDEIASNIITTTISLLLKKSGDGYNNTYSLIKDACKYEMLGTATRKLKNMVVGLRDVKSNILITGESGTGKELVARMLNRSSANTRSFVPINCSGIPETLFESELFGYKKGAFTGALYDKKGLVEQADGGDLFLDEIGELPLALQAKLLRVLQDGEFFKVGSAKPIKSNFRLISATNKNLEQMVSAGEFRKDLYYRINVVRIKTDPLREKISDISCLFKFFSLLQLNELGLSGFKLKLTKSALKKLSKYDWEGNIRELKNVVDRTLVKCKLAQNNVLDADDIELEGLEFLDKDFSVPKTISDISPDGYRKFLVQTRRLYYNSALRAVNGNVDVLADKLGLGRSTVFRHLKN